MKRRTLLQAIGLSPFAASQAKLQSDEITKMTIAHEIYHDNAAQAGIVPNQSIDYKRAYKWLGDNPVFMAELRDIISSELKDISRIDHDLLLLKAISPAAKLYIQRQRNIDARIHTIIHGDIVDSSWKVLDHWMNFARKALGI